MPIVHNLGVLVTRGIRVGICPSSSLKLSNVGPGQYLDGRPCKIFLRPGQTGWQPDHIFAAAVHNSTQLCGQIVPSLDGFHLIWQPVK